MKIRVIVHNTLAVLVLMLFGYLLNMSSYYLAFKRQFYNPVCYAEGIYGNQTERPLCTLVPVSFMKINVY